ncbi:hypothetical protein [Mannheimia sp. ZY171111]|uniref:hypothetical protein n=1 Tax=Mannheimia sp. ZY171111 TaxID=2679995 RepID=UPI001ADD787E|nr:hypothetical protein [Mannheimia sp. ZY171111]QTM00436.1 hypothetical protein GM698_01760 [Mannheimia sp. ZY171111]
MKLICSPISKSAMDRLNYGAETKHDLLEVVVDIELYDKMWRLGFFNEVNKTLNKHIDDYEDENITSFLDLIRLKSINAKYKEYDGIFFELEKLIFNAIKNNTGVFFFF